MHACRKDKIFKQRRLNHIDMGEGYHGTQSHAAEPYSCLQVCVLSENKFLSEIILVQKIFSTKISLIRNNSLVQKNVWSQRTCGQKKFFD